jgi:hypothetical protein
VYSCPYFQFFVRQVLFAPDIDTITCSPIIELIDAPLSSSDPSMIVSLNKENISQSCCRFLYLRDESAVAAARRTAQLFAGVLGAKRCAFVIDALFAEMFESCSRSLSSCSFGHNHLLINEGFDRRLHWSGQCVLATELLKGILRIGPNKQLTKSTLHIFSSLASSVFPVIVSDCFWTLPTVLDVDHVDAGGMGAEQSDKAFPSRNQKQSDRNAGGTDRSVTITNSNVILLSVLMGFIRQFTRALGDSMRFNLPTILFPILERASPIGNHPSVQRASISSLQDITVSLGHKDISSLIASNFDYLVDVISLRLRTYARDHVSMERSLVGVVDVILRSAVYHGGSSSIGFQESSIGNEMPGCTCHVSLVGHMLNCLLNHLDRQSHMTNLSMFDIARVFRSMSTFMDSSIVNKISELSVAALYTPEDKDDWFQRLDFELNVDLAGCDPNDDVCDQQEFNNDEKTPDDAPPVESLHSRKDDVEIDFTHEIGSINIIVSRCCYLLCYADIQIQVLCCETILSGFHSLGKVGLFRRKLHGESASNPLFPAIAEFWPSIIARLRSASMSLSSVNKLSRSELSIRHIMATDQEQGLSRARVEVLISKLLLIVSELCLSSDGFFVDRFENDAYPIIAMLMTDLLPTDSDSIRRPDQPSSFAGQNHALLLSVIHCLKCTFESGCRHGLASLISSIGAMLFPLLAMGGSLGDETTATIKAMLEVDRDALWRGLQVLSRRIFPCNPIPSFPSASTPASLQWNENGSIRLSKKAGELIDFMEQLLEQQI